MRLILRILIGLAGVLGVLVGLRVWQAPEAVAEQLGVAATGPLGVATLRADFGAFFAVGGALAIVAAVKARGEFLLAPTLLLGAALAGRAATALIDGFTPEMGPPMAVEAVLTALFAFGGATLRRG